MKIVGERVVHQDRWIEYLERSYLDRDGEAKRWSFVRRVQERRAVVVIPVTRESGSLILIRQYRVPLGALALEFPAGLVDDGEAPEHAALRELREESGYDGELVSLSPPVCTSPGLTSELVHAVRVLCPEEPAALPAPESSEQIEVVKLPPGAVDGYFRDFAAAGGIIDSRVLFFRLGQQGGS